MRKVQVDMKIVVKAMSRGNELSPHSVSQVTGRVRASAKISDNHGTVSHFHR